MTTSLSHIICQIDAFLCGRILGTLIVDDEQAYLETKDKLITLNDSYEIEIIINGEYHSITYHQAITTMSSDGWSLYGGFDCRVKSITT